MFNTLSIMPGTILFHGSNSFSATSYNLPVTSFPGIAFFSSQEIASRYGPVTKFVVLERFVAVKLNDPSNVLLWKRALPDADKSVFEDLLSVNHLKVIRASPNELQFSGLPVRKSESSRDKEMFEKLMDIAGVNAIYVDAETTMHHPEISIRFELTKGPFFTTPAIERAADVTPDIKQQWLNMIGRMEGRKTPKEVGHSDMSAYTKMIYQRVCEHNLPHELYIWTPLGLEGKESIYDFSVPDYDKDMSAAGIDNTIYAALTKRWASFFKGDILDRQEVPIVLGCLPSSHFNEGDFQVFQQRVVDPPPRQLAKFFRV